MDAYLLVGGFVLVKIALIVLFVVQIQKGLRLGEKIAERRRAEAAAAEPEPAVEAAAMPAAPAEVERPAA